MEIKKIIHENALETVVCEMAAILARGVGCGVWVGGELIAIPHSRFNGRCVYELSLIDTIGCQW